MEEQNSTGSGWQLSVFNELHRLAENALKHESPGHSLQPTLLVNDAYLKLAQQRNIDPKDRSLVIAAGANIIRRLLVDYARKRKAHKRGGPDGRGVPLNISIAVETSEIDIIELDEALIQLASQNERAAKVVELKFFGGLTGQDIANELKTSLKTVNNDWRFAKAWLYRQLAADEDVKNNGE